MYKKYVKVENGIVVESLTDGILKDTNGWEDVGEQEDRHYQLTYKDTDGISKYKLVNDKVIERTSAEIEADKIIHIKEMKIERAKTATIRKLAENDSMFISKKTEIEAAKTLTAINNVEDL
jgi:hypothetical protein